MLGKQARVKITSPIHSVDENGFTYELNFGYLLDDRRMTDRPALVMGIDHPVNTFFGRVIAVIRKRGQPDVFVLAPKATRYIINDVKAAVSFYYGENCHISCFYESSCGAVVFRYINGERRFLLIKNKRSSNWGFPKGHIERGESKEETARREVFEETGIRIKIVPGFVAKSEYTIHSHVEKTVSIFLASTKDTQTKIQTEEIEDYMWLGYDAAMKHLRFENDRSILERAQKYLLEHVDKAREKAGDADD